MKSSNKIELAVQLLNSMEKNCLSVEECHSQARVIRDYLQEFFMDNIPSKKGVFNIMDYASGDKYTPVLNGVCYDTNNQCAVATDAHLLVVDKGSYDPDIVEKLRDEDNPYRDGRLIVDAYGKRVEGRYPNYPNVIPDSTNFTKFDVDAKVVDEYVRKCTAYLKANDYVTGKKQNYCYYYRVGEAYYKAERLYKFLIASEGHISYGSPIRAAVWKTENRTSLLMPMLPIEDPSKVIGAEQGLYIIRN